MWGPNMWSLPRISSRLGWEKRDQLIGFSEEEKIGLTKKDQLIELTNQGPVECDPKLGFPKRSKKRPSNKIRQFSDGVKSDRDMIFYL